jgi:hypothetical protein
MDVGAALRGAMPVLAMSAGTAVVAGGVAFASHQYVAGADKPNMSHQLVGALGGPLIAGGLTWVAAGMILPRTPLGSHLGRLGGLALFPGAILGSLAGAALARRVSAHQHDAEYKQQEALFDPTIAATQAMFRAAGASKDVIDSVPVRYDRAHLNATYHPPIGPFGDNILVGRYADTGVPLGTNDVIAHEFSHKVVHEYAPRLMWSMGGDAKSMHESLADTFAMAVDTDDWLVAEDAIPGGGRSFSHPELRGALKDGVPEPAPITREQLESSSEEHLGAGVGNKVAWRIGSALGRDEMAALYVAALERRELGFNATYDDLARVVRAAADERWGAGSEQARIVDDAWRQAGY